MQATADDVMREVRSAVVDTAKCSPGETVQRRLEQAAYRLGISYSRAWAYWYQKVRNVPAEEYLQIKGKADAVRRRRIEELRQEIARLEALDRKDSDLVSERGE